MQFILKPVQTHTKSNDFEEILKVRHKAVYQTHAVSIFNVRARPVCLKPSKL